MRETNTNISQYFHRRKPVKQVSLINFPGSRNTVACSIIPGILPVGKSSPNVFILDYAGLHVTVAPRRQDGQAPVLEKFTFVPYIDGPTPKGSSMDGVSKEGFFNAIQEGPLLKVMLDTVIENKIGTNLKICEVGAAEGKVFSRVVPLLSLHPLVQLSYTVTDKTEDLVAAISEAASGDTIEVCAWDVAKKPPGGVNKSDLVIASNLIHQTSDLSSALENIKSALGPRGFLLLHEVTASLETARAIFGKNGFTASGQEQKYFLTDQQWVKALEAVGLNVVSLKKLGSVSTLLLCRFTNNVEEKPIFFDVDESFEFVPQLQTALTSNDKTPIWLRSFTSSPTGIVGMTNCLRQEMGGERIRCLFASPETKGKVMEQFEAIKKLDLVMNVFEDGKFGSYRSVKRFYTPKIQTSSFFINSLGYKNI